VCIDIGARELWREGEQGNLTVEIDGAESEEFDESERERGAKNQKNKKEGSGEPATAG
jgi:hypothetical protein